MSFRIVLADDHPIVSSGVRQLLEHDRSLSVVAVVTSPDELLSTLDNTPCDLLITDFNMPGEQASDGLGLLGLIQRKHPTLPVIVLTMITNTAVLRSVLGVGVRGLISKADTLTELPLAVSVVAKGRNYVSISMKGYLEAETAKLSPRETEVLRLFASGYTVSQIALQLNRSVKTVSSQKMEAMNKLGIKSDLGIYAYAREHGLL
ncbi:two-component system capsular synthesis response regulator RcsB [Lysobacter niastensis]|uniref:Two-component system capsular synthesis response regulator RcsB n=1 Tax=Lysobacter niastensis TaxID=380629 RepID=A0ABU1WCS9_9GAMM|nr:response regulator transcription factor [Lysobacter niastensis]MDR7135398.1 two-component system capsular synthesis response regulator RcsB [Lysobacter niastensis]